MDVHPVNAAGNSLSELFPHQAAALESDDSSQEWLSVFVEDCFSGSSALANPVLGKTTPSVANQGARNPKLLPPSASNERRLRKRSFNSSANDDQQYTIPLFVEPPLLLIDQKHWMAESELILPKKDEDQERCHQQEQEYEEEKCGEDVLTEFHQGLLLKEYSDAFGLKIEPENRFSTISGMQFDQGTNKKKKKKEQGKQREKKKIKKTANDTERELPLGAPVKMCTHCMSSKTPQWRAGPLGPKTLCNACGVRYKSGRLLPEYRPANSPTFVSHIHSNSHKKVLQLRKAM